MKSNRTTAKQGFTLVEIMIVVAIIALLAAIAVPNFLRARKRSQATIVLNDLRLISAAVDQYAIDNSKIAGAPCAWADVQNYLKQGTRLYNSNCTDIFGNPYGGTTLPAVGEIDFNSTPAPQGPPPTLQLTPGGGSSASDAPGAFVIDGQVELSSVTFAALSDVAPSEFWSPWGPAESF